MAKGKQPDFNVRAKVGDYWNTVGAAWKVKDGGISIRLNTVPVGGEWDGSLLLLPPKVEEAPKDDAKASTTTPPQKEPVKETAKAK